MPTAMQSVADGHDNDARPPPCVNGAGGTRTKLQVFPFQVSTTVSLYAPPVAMHKVADVQVTLSRTLP